MIYIAQQGRIADCVHAALQQSLGNDQVEWARNAHRSSKDDLVILAVDGCNLYPFEQWEQKVRASGSRLLCIHVHGGEAIIGPEIAPDRKGCISCWATRYYAGRKTARRFLEGASSVLPSEDPWLTPLAAFVVGQIAAKWVVERRARVSGNGHGAQLVTHYYWDLKTLTGREWQLLEDPSCLHCGELPFDSAEIASLNVTSRPKPHLAADRLRDVRELQEKVENLYVGFRAGIVPEVNLAYRHTHGAVAIADVSLSDSNDPEPCSGFSDRYSTARTMAILEAVERYSGSRLRARRPAIHGSVSSLRGLSVDPKVFGLYSEDGYKSHADLLTPYDDKLEMDFVWAYSFAQRRPVLVPKQLGFYSQSHDKPLFVIEGSNGCAIGNCPEEAILHGIFEVVERDAFLLTWYARRRRPRLDLTTSRDPEVRHRCRRLEADGFEIIALDITTDFAIPAVWLMIRRREPKMPYAACVGAAHLHPERAIRKGLRELDAVLQRCILELNSPNVRNRALRLAEDPTQVRTMSDHALLYCVPESGRHLEFLAENTDCTPLQALEDLGRELRSPDLGEELQRSVDRILQTAKDVIVIDQTTPEQFGLDLCTYKALIPGAIPIGWGYDLRRVVGLERLDMALTNGHMTDKRLGLNLAPHPFS